MEKLKIGDRFDMYESLPSEYKNSFFKAGTQRLMVDRLYFGNIRWFICFNAFNERTLEVMTLREIKKIGTWVVKRIVNHEEPCTII